MQIPDGVWQGDMYRDDNRKRPYPVEVVIENGEIIPFYYQIILGPKFGGAWGELVQLFDSAFEFYEREYKIVQGVITPTSWKGKAKFTIVDENILLGRWKMGHYSLAADMRPVSRCSNWVIQLRRRIADVRSK